MNCRITSRCYHDSNPSKFLCGVDVGVDVALMIYRTLSSGIWRSAQEFGGVRLSFASDGTLCAATLVGEIIAFEID